MNGVTWKFKQGMNCWEGTIKGDKEPLLFIEGRLCVSDLRESRSSNICISPKHYKIIGLSIKEAKELAEDLVMKRNFDKHEQNRLDWIAEQDRTTKIIEEAEHLIKELQKDKYE